MCCFFQLTFLKSNFKVSFFRPTIATFLARLKKHLQKFLGTPCSEFIKVVLQHPFLTINRSKNSRTQDRTLGRPRKRNQPRLTRRLKRERSKQLEAASSLWSGKNFYRSQVQNPLWGARRALPEIHGCRHDTETHDTGQPTTARTDGPTKKHAKSPTKLN